MKLPSLNMALKDAIVHFVVGELAKQDNFNPNHPTIDRTNWTLNHIQEINDDFDLWMANCHWSGAQNLRIEMTVHEKTRRVQEIRWMKDTPKFKPSKAEKPQRPENYGVWS